MLTPDFLIKNLRLEARITITWMPPKLDKTELLHTLQKRLLTESGIRDFGMECEIQQWRGSHRGYQSAMLLHQRAQYHWIIKWELSFTHQWASVMGGPYHLCCLTSCIKLPRPSHFHFHQWKGDYNLHFTDQIYLIVGTAVELQGFTNRLTDSSNTLNGDQHRQEQNHSH